MYSIETKDLKHSFGKNLPTISNIDLKVPKGSIFGFLGKNGAGKTTTLKLILGLLQMQQGEIFLFGKKLNEDRIEILKRIGSLIESPSYYAHLSATENLNILQKIYQCPVKRVSEVLELVGLTASKDKNVSQFSLGMKQRLSIAIALLHEPELLILDEPTNGLDPKGIIEIRELLIRINQELGCTIVISSHLLTEVEILVDHLAILNNGNILFQGKMTELNKKATTTLTVTVDKPEKAKSIISSLGLQSELVENSLSITNFSPPIIPILIKTLVESNVSILRMNEQKLSLESIFMHLTKL